MIGRVRQISYLVADLDEAMATRAAAYHEGPWFAHDPLPVEDADYRGRPAPLELRLASTFSGDLEIELIQPLGGHPSAYQEAIDDRGHGLHHVCYHSDDLVADVRSMEAAGHEVVEDFTVAGGFRIVYLTPHGTLGPYVELIQLTAAVDELFDTMKRAAATWDGHHQVIYPGSVA